MSNATKNQNHVVTIHGKEYVTVAGRLTEAHNELKQLSITTELLPVQDKIVIKATVITPKGTFTGISAANPSKMIERESPYEVAETSAVGRALGFAGYGSTESIASADEVSRVEAANTSTRKFVGATEWQLQQINGLLSELNDPKGLEKVLKHYKVKTLGEIETNRAYKLMLFLQKKLEKKSLNDKQTDELVNKAAETIDDRAEVIG